MKSIFTSFLFTLAAILCAQNVTIPDANFKNALLTHDPVIDTNSDGEIQVWEAEAVTMAIDVRESSISDLTGIEAFININSLICHLNNLSEVNLESNTNLQNLTIYENDLNELDLSHNPLLLSLSASGNNLNTLDLSHNPLLTELYVGYNNLTSMDLTGLTQLYYFGTVANHFESINLSENHSLLFASIQSEPDLLYINLQNGNNENMQVYLSDNPSLVCVQIDPEYVASPPFIWEYPEGTNFSEDCSLGTDDLKESEIKIYPNPTQNQLFIDSNENLKQIDIFSISGEKIITKNELNNLGINVSNLITGTYIIRVKTESGKIYTQKFIKN